MDTFTNERLFAINYRHYIRRKKLNTFLKMFYKLTLFSTSCRNLEDVRDKPNRALVVTVLFTDKATVRKHARTRACVIRERQ